MLQNVELKRLARNCKFEDKLNDMLRDRIVCGIGDTAMQRKMLMKEDLKYEDAVKIAVGSETSMKQAGEMGVKVKQEPGSVNKLDEEPRKRMCNRCGDTRHKSDDCFFKDKVCFKCDKKGHTQKMCRGAKNSQSKPQTSNNSKYKGAGKPNAQNKVSHREDLKTVRKKDQGTKDSESRAPSNSHFSRAPG